jgi:hypothetical protein
LCFFLKKGRGYLATKNILTHYEIIKLLPPPYALKTGMHKITLPPYLVKIICAS